MDPLTHGLLGAAIGQVTTKRSLIKQASWVGGLSAMTPDLDMFIHSNQNPVLDFIYHRNFTHSLFFAPIGGLFIAGLFLLVFKKLRANWPYVLLAAIIGMMTHGLLDSATSYGTLWLWPFSYRRISWDLIAIIDPIFTGFLLVGMSLTYAYKNRWFALSALICCLLYLGFGYLQHHRSLVVQQQLAESRQHTMEKAKTMPHFASLLGFSSIYTVDDRIYLDNILTPLFSAAYSEKLGWVPLVGVNNLPLAIKNRPALVQDFLYFDWFTSGFTGLVSKEPYVVADFRFTRGIHPPKPLWGILFPKDPNRSHVYVETGFK